jgi:hypothetical protein
VQCHIAKWYSGLVGGKEQAMKKFNSHVPQIVVDTFNSDVPYFEEWFDVWNACEYKTVNLNGKELTLMFTKEGPFVFNDIEGPSMTLGLYIKHFT